jgi:hypothetical protein
MGKAQILQDIRRVRQLVSGARGEVNIHERECALDRLDDIEEFIRNERD